MKLTESCRREITRRAIEGTFKTRKEKLATKENALAEKIYNLIYPQDVVKEMDHLPEEFFYRKKCMTVSGGGSRYEMNLRESKRVAACDNQWEHPQLVVNPQSKLLSEAKAISDAEASIENDIRSAKIKLTQFLAGISTWKRLEEAWPEGKEYYKIDIPSASLPNPPMITGAEVQRTLKALAR